MTLLVVMKTPQGIVMSADSLQTSFDFIENKDGLLDRKCVFRSLYGNKIYMTGNNFGISTYGDATLSGIPISNYIEEFISKNTINDIHKLAESIYEYFTELSATPYSTNFFLCGYDDQLNQCIYSIDLYNREIQNMSAKSSNAHCYWGGHTETLARLMKPVKILDGHDCVLGESNYDFNNYNIQDCIDFCLFVTNATIGAMRFQRIEETVGGDIDILVITPKSSRWIAKKDLSSNHKAL